jgi:hypothetical protein
LSDFVVTQPIQVIQDDGDLKGLGQFSDGTAQQAMQFGSLGFRCGVKGAFGEKGNRFPFVRQFGNFGALLGSATAAKAKADGDAAQPEGKGMDIPQSPQVAECMDEGVLRGVFGIFPMAKERQRQAKNDFFIAHHQRHEGLFVAVLCPPNQ